MDVFGIVVLFVGFLVARTRYAPPRNHEPRALLLAEHSEREAVMIARRPAPPWARAVPMPYPPVSYSEMVRSDTVYAGVLENGTPRMPIPGRGTPRE